MNKQFAASDMMQNLMNPTNSVSTIRMLTSFGTVDMIKNFADKVDMLVSGGDLMQAAIYYKKNDLVQFYLSKGARIDSPPDNFQKLNEDKLGYGEQYRKTPYIIQAAISGADEVLKTLQEAGCKLSETGPICLSKKRKNCVYSNAIGAACYWGQDLSLGYCLSKMSRTSINAVVTEKQDEIAGRGTYQKEYAGYTPLMLACASSFDSIKCVKLLLRNQADHTCQDAQENTLLHVAAMNDNNTVLHHLVSYVKLDLFARNKNGETALNICQQKKNADGIKILEKASSQQDQSVDKSKDLLDELLREEQKEVEKKQKKKDKKKRAAITKLAKEAGVTYEEMEERLEQKEKEKEEAERQAKLDEERKEREAAELEKKQREERRRLLLQRQREEEEESRRAEQEERQREIEEKRRQREEQQARRKVYRKDQDQKQQQHSDDKRANQQRRPQRQQNDQQNDKSQSSGAQSKGGLKQEHLKQRDQEYDKKKEQIQALLKQDEDDLNRLEAQIDNADAKSVKSTKSQKSLVKNVNEDGTAIIYGLGDNMLKNLMPSDKAKRRMQKKLKQEEAERDAEKQRQAQVLKEREEEEKTKRKAEAEVLKQQRLEERKKKQAEKLEAKKKAEAEKKQAGSGEEKPQAETEKKQPDSKKKGAEKAATQQVYKVKEKKSEQPAAGAEQTKEIVIEKKSTAKDTTPKESKVQEKSESSQAKENTSKKEKKQKETIQVYKPKAAKVESDTVKEDAKPKEEPVAMVVQKKEQATAGGDIVIQKKSDSKQKEVSAPLQLPKANKQQKAKENVEESASQNQQSSSKSDNQEFEALQLILTGKEQEIVDLKHDVRDLQDQLKHAQETGSHSHGHTSHSDKDLQSKVNQLNEKLLKQNAMHRILTEQLLEAERKLEDESQKRQKAESQLSQQSAPTPSTITPLNSSEKNLLTMANEQLRTKGQKIQDLQESLSDFRGEDLDKKSKEQLLKSQQILKNSLSKIQSALASK